MPAFREGQDLTLAPGVNSIHVHPMLWLFLGALARDHRLKTEEGLVITSLRRPVGGRASWHSPPNAEAVRAADLRRTFLDALAKTEMWCLDLQHLWGRFLGVVLEPEWLTPEEIEARGGLAAVEPHIHVQLKRIDWPGAL